MMTGTGLPKAIASNGARAQGNSKEDEDVTVVIEICEFIACQATYEPDLTLTLTLGS